jgi:hypothetical protein
LLQQVKRADVVLLAGDRLRVECQLNSPPDLTTDLVLLKKKPGNLLQ